MRFCELMYVLQCKHFTPRVYVDLVRMYIWMTSTDAEYASLILIYIDYSVYVQLQFSTYLSMHVCVQISTHRFLFMCQYVCLNCMYVMVCYFCQHLKITQVYHLMFVTQYDHTNVRFLVERRACVFLYTY